MADSTRSWSEPAVGAGRPTVAQPSALAAPAARSALALVTVAAVASWLGFYFITGLPYLDLEPFRQTVVLHAVTGAAFLPYLIALVVRRRLPGGSPLDLPVVFFAAALLLTTATSLDWRLSLEVALLGLMAVGAFYVLSDRSVFRGWQVETALMLAVLAAAAWALYKVGNDYLEWLRLTDAVRGGIGLSDLIPPTVPEVHNVGDHKNILGGIFAMGLPFFAVAMFRPIAARWRALAALGAAAVVLALFFTLARSAWMAGVAGTATALVLLVAVTPSLQAYALRIAPSTPRGRWAAALIALGALALIAAAAFYAALSVESRPVWLFRASGTPRLDAIEAGAEMLSDRPLTGTGPGMYRLLYPEYSGRYPNHAFHSHNGFLQTAIDMGVPGALAMLALIGALAWLLVRGLRDGPPAARTSAAASAGALVAFAVFSLFDAPNTAKGQLIALAAAGAVAALSAPARPGAGPLAPASRRDYGASAQLAARLVVPVLMVGVLITWGRLDLAHYYYSSAVTNANAGRWLQAVDHAGRAVDFDREYAVYRLQLGIIYGQTYLASNDATFYQGAVRELGRAVELEPRSAIAYANLALLHARAGQREQAREAAQQTLRFANSDPAVVLAAGTALEASNYGDDAVRAYSHALLLDVNLADSPFWSGSPFRETRFPDILGQSAVVFNQCALLGLRLDELAIDSLRRQDAFDACAAHVAAAPDDADARVALGEALIEDGAFEEAFPHLDYVADRKPDYGPARTALGRWYAGQGRLDEARREWLRAGELGEVEALVLLGDSYPDGAVPAEVVDKLRSELRGATSQVQFHLTGILYYRLKFFRGSPHTILLPGEWQDAVPARFAQAEAALARWTAR